MSLCALTQSGEVLWRSEFEQQAGRFCTLVSAFRDKLYVAVFSNDAAFEQVDRLHGLYVLDENGVPVFSSLLDDADVNFVCLTSLDNQPTLLCVSYEQYTNQPWICVAPLDFAE